MRIDRLGWALMTFTCAALAACSAADGDRQAPGEPADEVVVQRDEALGEGGGGAVCTSQLRWVGIHSPPAACPAPVPAAGWAVARLISDPAAPPTLARYCEYEWVASGPPNVAALPSITVGGKVLPYQKWLDRDCDKLARMSPASEAAATVAPTLAAAHRTQMELPLTPLTAGSPVDVAIVDTWPDVSLAGRSHHGLGMASIVEAVACGSVLAGTCPVTTFPSLALDRFNSDGDRDLVHGGAWGFPGRLAAAIYAAVNQPSVGHRVINLSVAWDGRYNESTSEPGTLAKPMAAVLDALKYAACQNVLVIAAAGNITGNTPLDVGPEYPAAWETLPAPACTGASRPLLYSAHAVDGRDKPVWNTRAGGRSKLAAPGFSVPGTKSVAGVDVPAGPFTGTSVAAAGVSGLAALVWSYDTTLAPHEVMNIIRANGQALPVQADYCFSAPCGPVRRVSVCRSLAAVGVAATCSTIPAGAGANPVYSSTTLLDLDAIGPNPADGAALSIPFQPAGCTVPTRSDANGPGDAAHACPSDVLPAEALYPSVDPQPGPREPPDGYISKIDESVSIWVGDNEPNAFIVPQTLTLTLNRVAVARYDLSSAVDKNSGKFLSEGLAVGTFTEISMPGLIASVNFDAAQIEWKSDVTYDATALVIKQ